MKDANVCQNGQVKIDEKCKSSTIVGKKYGFLYDRIECLKNNISFNNIGGPWIEGHIENNYFQARVFDNPSKHGIKRGRISNLIITEGLKTRDIKKNIYNYDRGFDGGTKKGMEFAEKIRKTFPVIRGYLS